MITKQALLELVGQLPDRVDVEEVIHRLYLLEKLAAAEDDIVADRLLSTEEVRRRVAEWRR